LDIWTFESARSRKDLKCGTDKLTSLNFELTREAIRTVHEKKVVVLGATGMVGRTLMAELKNRGFVNVKGVSKNGSVEAEIKAVDLTYPAALETEIANADIVINAAVDLNFSGMEGGGEGRANARAVNVGIPEAVVNSGFRGKFVQLSTFYVFGDISGWALPDDLKIQIQYMVSRKLSAEQVVASLPDSMVVRLGPLIGVDERSQQKKFYADAIAKLEAERWDAALSH